MNQATEGGGELAGEVSKNFADCAAKTSEHDTEKDALAEAREDSEDSEDLEVIKQMAKAL
eukprot:CAMPEP_0170494428 /NCGR_PEP_ID=MMETSP0208-20121228/14639_1 /TAXON_ID=197538 /ORGANISM="Strombidium inclinatum, Strain S3" /LENGTH=59 /DNA_ID=CAMNT_0010770487 /DNA_START=19 /DNA_END=198 /DNA_ORIENTATION=-